MLFQRINKDDIPWRPNFRYKDNLPDIKLVRTHFLGNSFISVFTIILLGCVLFYSYELLDVNGRNKDLEKSIQNRSPKNRQLLLVNSNFIKSSKIALYFKAFYEGWIDPIECLLQFYESRNQDIIFHDVSYEYAPIHTDDKKKGNIPVYQFQITGTVQGSYDYALSIVHDYSNKIKENPYFKPHFSNLEIASLERDSILDIFTFSIKVVLSKVDSKINNE